MHATVYREWKTEKGKERVWEGGGEAPSVNITYA